ncbi:MAG: phosphoethanolamine transferase [Prevotella sp.]|nr:phosphoethanolamine transferase [Prevotella sp.]MBQ9237333.1 phosphoethanolamine transferase [Prevotella sp.]
MPILLRPIATKFFLFMYLLGIVSSIVTVPDWKGAHMYVNAPWELFLDVYLLSALVCLIPTGTGINLRTVVKGVIYCVMYPLYIIDTFCFVKFGSTLNPTMLLLLGETNAGEATEFFQNYLTPDILLTEVGIIMLVPLGHIALATLDTKTKGLLRKLRNATDVATKTKRVVRIIVDVVILAMLAMAAYCGAWDNKALFHKTMAMRTIGEVEHSLAYNPHTEMYQPTMRLAFSIRSNQLIAQQLDNLFATLDRAEVDSCDMKSPNIVLIIGESFNKRHAQLYGYDKKNMPNQVRLERSGLLTKMDDAISPWNLTSFFFKHLMTTYCVGDTAEWCDYPLFCQLFRKAGYRVTFLTNQFLPKAKEAVYDFSGGFFINNERLSAEQFDVRNKKLHVFDEGLLSDYDNVNVNGTRRDEPQANSENGNLTIFHLMGQHVNYRTKCPNSKKRWGADSYPDDMDMPAKRRKIMADYDNAVWYNDSVVNQIIERFKDKEAIIIYVPDHGEEVFGPGVRHFCGRMHDAVITKRLADEEFRVPMWIYCTPRYKVAHPDVFQAVKQAKGKRYMTDATSHMLMGLAGIHSKYYRADYDLLSPRYNSARKRIIKNQVDYDSLK